MADETGIIEDGGGEEEDGAEKQSAEKHNKFSEAEMLLGVFFFGGLDVIAILIDVTGVGLVIAPVVQSFATLSQTLWFWSKGDKNAIKFGRQVAKYAANALAVVPTLTIAFIVEAQMHNNPKIKAAVSGKIGEAMKAA